MTFMRDKWAFLYAVAALIVVVAYAGPSDGVTLRLRNESDNYLSIHWINPKSQATKPIKTNVIPRSSSTVNSYVTHRFEVREEPDPETGHCGDHKDDACKIGTFEVTESVEQGFLIKNGLKIETVVPNKSEERKSVLLDKINLDVVEDPKDSLAYCRRQAELRLVEIDGAIDKEVNALIHKDLQECLATRLTPRIKASDDEVEFERTLRVEASNIAENFTCVNVGLESSPDVETENWVSEIDGLARTVHKKLERAASRIHLVENFASPEECKAMEEEAEADLKTAYTADGKGGSKISINRKAKQAGIHPKFTQDGQPLDGNLISVLSARVYEYTNHALDMNITHHGQEPLMSIQYFGRGKHDIEPDRYTPHCDGRCNGEKHIYGGRMATTVIYCTIPEKGGFTNFQNANVHVKPNSGSAVFFSYFDPLTNVTDNGLTRHSGCPVYEGEKKIITQWVRYGVSQDTPHSAFNTLTILKSEDGE